MKKSNLIWGIICLVIAGGLTIANLRLPPESLMFKFGDVNMPWVPPVVLGIIGIILGWAMLVGYVFFMFYPSVVEKRMKKAVKN